MDKSIRQILHEDDLALDQVFADLDKEGFFSALKKNPFKSSVKADLVGKINSAVATIRVNTKEGG